MFYFTSFHRFGQQLFSNNRQHFSNCTKLNGFYAENAQKPNISLTYFLAFAEAASNMAYGAALQAHLFHAAFPIHHQISFICISIILPYSV